MPIKKERLAEVVASARALLTLRSNLADEVKEAFEDYSAGKKGADEALGDLYSTVMHTPIDPRHIELIAREEERYKWTRHKNERSKVYAERKRKGQTNATERPMPHQTGLSQHEMEVLAQQSGDDGSTWEAETDALLTDAMALDVLGLSDLGELAPEPEPKEGK